MKKLLIIFTLLLPLSALAAISFDAKGNSGEKNGASSVSFNMTVGSISNGVLVVGSHIRNSNNSAYVHITGCTWNTSENFTLGARQDSPAASRYLSAEVWYLKNPTAGTHTVVCTYASSFDTAYVTGTSFAGVDQTTTIDATSGLSTLTGNPWTTTITTANNNDWIVNALYTASDLSIYQNNGETVSASSTMTVNHNPDQAGTAYLAVPTAGSQTTGWNNGGAGNDEGAMAIVSLKPATAISFSSLTTGSDTDGNSTASTASVAPTGNRLQLLSIASRTGITTNPNQPTVTGGGLTWVAVNSVVYDDTSSTRRRITLFRALSASPSSGALSIDFGGQNQTDVLWSLDEAAGVDTSGTNGSGAVVQSAVNHDGTATVNTLTVTLSAFSDASNATYGTFSDDNGVNIGTEGSGFTKLTGHQSAVNAIELLTEYNTGNDTTVDYSFGGTNGDTGGIAVELKAAATATTTTDDTYFEVIEE